MKQDRINDSCLLEQEELIKSLIGVRFKQINDRFIAIQNEMLRESDLTYQQMAAMYYLCQNKDRAVSQKDICTFLQVRHTTVIGILERLEDKGMIIRKINPDNKKFRMYELTEKGSGCLEEDFKHVVTNDRLLVKGMTENEVNCLRVLLDKVDRNLREMTEGESI